MTTVATLLSASHSEYLSLYSGYRDSVMREEVLKKIEFYKATPLEKMDNVFDMRRFITAERLVSLIDRVHQIRGAIGEKALKEVISTKQFMDDVKWLCVHPRQCVSEGTLKLAWSGINLNGKASKIFSDHTAKYGQSKVAVTEHPVPTKVLKDGLFSKHFRNAPEVLKYVLQRNFICYTSAPEDNTLSKCIMPNKGFFSRYDEAEVKVFILDDAWQSGPDAVLVMSRLMKSAAMAKGQGLTFESWVESIVSL